jgi:hypothetical protein
MRRSRARLRWTAVAALMAGCLNREPRGADGIDAIGADALGAYALRVDVPGRIDRFRLLADDIPMTTEPLPEDPAQALFVFERTYPAYSEALEAAPVQVSVTDSESSATISTLEVRPGECDQRCGGDCGIGTMVQEDQHLTMSADGILAEACAQCRGDTGMVLGVCP